MDIKNVKICDECKSTFLASSSKMMGLYPECASALYGYENCKHIFKQGRCMKCYGMSIKANTLNGWKRRFEFDALYIIESFAIARKIML